MNQNETIDNIDTMDTNDHQSAQDETGVQQPQDHPKAGRLPADFVFTPQQVDALLRTDLNFFISRAFRELNPQTPYLPNWHVEYIAYKLMQIERGEITRLIINVPPRNLKSICASVAFVAWLLGRHPEKRIICASYAQDLSLKLASDTRQVMSSPWYERIFPLTRLVGARPAVADFSTTANGNRLAVSTGGGITGRGADVLIIDDPLKPDEAASEVTRKHVNDWFDSTAYTRLNSKKHGAVIIIMQRLHMDDLVGHALEKGGWDVVNLPAIAEEDQEFNYPILDGTTKVIKWKVGSALHPEREPLEVLTEIRANVGEYAFAGQYQQSPVPLGGGMIKTEWIHYYAPQELPSQYEILIQSWDTASKNHQFADYSVCVTLGLKNKVIYVVDLYRARLDFPALRQTALNLFYRYKPHHILIEDAASGIQLNQELKEQQIYCLKPIKPSGDKQTRMHAQTSVFESVKIKFPQEAAWLRDCVSELTSFPQGKHDDQVDALSQGIGYLRERLDEPGIFAFYRMEHEKMMRAKGYPT